MGLGNWSRFLPERNFKDWNLFGSWQQKTGGGWAGPTRTPAPVAAGRLRPPSLLPELRVRGRAPRHPQPPAAPRPPPGSHRPARPAALRGADCSRHRSSGAQRPAPTMSPLRRALGRGWRCGLPTRGWHGRRLQPTGSRAPPAPPRPAPPAGAPGASPRAAPPPACVAPARKPPRAPGCLHFALVCPKTLALGGGPVNPCLGEGMENFVNNHS